MERNNTRRRYIMYLPEQQNTVYFYPIVLLLKFFHVLRNLKTNHFSALIYSYVSAFYAYCYLAKVF